MLDSTRIPSRDDGEVWAQFLDDLQSAMIQGMKAARALANGEPPNVDVLEEYARATEVLRITVLQRKVDFGWISPTEEDVRCTRGLVRLVREGVPNSALVEVARHAARMVTDPWELETFHAALRCIQKETSRVQHLPRIIEVLDQTLPFFERVYSVAGFVPTRVDIANVRRLREIVDADGAEARDERGRLVEELLARIPPGSTVDVLDDPAELLNLRR